MDILKDTPGVEPNAPLADTKDKAKDSLVFVREGIPPLPAKVVKSIEKGESIQFTSLLLGSSQGSPGGRAKGRGESLVSTALPRIAQLLSWRKSSFVNRTVTRVDVTPRTVQAQYG